jgi:PTH1 family peptidyl-tRNA hydrolase
MTDLREDADHAPSGAEPSSGRGQSPKLIVGLGNPGDRYRQTRHNVGFHVVDELARRRAWTLAGTVCNCRLASDDRLMLAQPQTYMNRSGYAVRCLSETRGFEPPDVLVVYDEVHLPLGRLRMRRKGSPGGHRGLESIVANLRSSEVPRLRLGIGPREPSAGDSEGPPVAAADEEGGDAPELDLVDFVLGEFELDEQELVRDMVQSAADACELWLAEGVEVAMNRFNG